jgi:hypothetical protein
MQKSYGWRACAAVAIVIVLALVATYSASAGTEAAPSQAVSAQSTSGMNYYVNSVSGSDGNAGTSSSLPWKTFSPLQSRTLQPGDTVNLARGSSWSGGLVIKNSGVSGNPITFQAYGSGARPTIQNAGQYEGISINADWVVLKDVLVRNVQERGISINQGSDHNVVSNVEATAVGVGVGVSGQYNLVTQSYFHDLTMVVNTSGGDDDYGAEGIVLYASNNEVAYSRFERCKAASYDYGTDGGAVELYGTVNNSYVHHNWATGNNGFMEVGGGQANNTLVAYNVSYNNGLWGGFHLTGTFGSAVSNFRLENNTIVETGSGWQVIWFDGTPTTSTLLMRNNVFYVGAFSALCGASAITHDHNLYRLTSGSTQLGFSLGSAERSADPLFVNLGGGDFHLQSSSPAINTGASLGYTADYDAISVPQGSAPDLGAFEFHASTPAPTATRTPAPTATKTVTRTPGPTATPTRTPTQVVAPTATRTPTATATNTPAPAATATRTPSPTATSTPQPAQTPVSGSIHSGDLDRSTTRLTGNYWKATVTVTVHNASHAPVAGVRVTGGWTNGYSGTSYCTTDSYGRCSMTTGLMANWRTSVTFTVKALTLSGSTYVATSNHDPDGDSNGTVAVVARPW